MGIWINIIILFFVVIFVSYVVGFIGWWIYIQASDVLGYRVGYPPLLVGLSSAILLLSDILIYVFVFRWFIVGKSRSVGVFSLKRFSRIFLFLSTPILVLTMPMIVAGVCGVLAEDIFYSLAVSTTIYWGAILSIYSLFIHFLYAPYCALAINLYVDIRDDPGVSISRVLKKSSSVIRYMFVVSIIVWLITTLVSLVLLISIPVLGELIIPIQKPPYHATWAETWYNIILKVVPRYYNLIVNPASYIIYAVIFRYLAIKTINKIFNYSTTKIIGTSST